jgi:membrane protein
MTDVSKRNSPPLGYAVQFIRTLVLRFSADGCLLYASALTYTTLLSLVPFLALMFAVLKGLGVQHRLEPLLLSRLSLSPEVTTQIITYIDQTNVRTLGALGAAALITSVISVLGSIEGSFNHIWRVQQGRTWYRKITDYVSTVLLTPLLLLAAVALTSSMHEQAVLRWILRTDYIGGAALQALRLAPFAINAVALGILYAVMPNRRPNAVAIGIGAVIAGCVWQLVQWAYVLLQIGVANYNAIYGAMAQLPVTLVWIYVSWTVVLAGAELAAVYEFGPNAGRHDAVSRWTIALHLLLRAAERFRGAGGPVDLRRLARELHFDPAAVSETAQQLRDGDLLVAVDGGEDRVVLARDPASIDLAVLAGLVDADSAPPSGDPRVRALMDRLSAERAAALRQRTLADLCENALEGAGRG